MSALESKPASEPAPVEATEPLTTPLATPAATGYTTMHKASVWRTVVSIAWAFFGVRKNSDYQEDIKKLNIFHIIFVGIAGCFVLVMVLMIVAQWATS